MSDRRTDDSVLLVVATFPDEEKARQIGTALVSEQLAACANMIPSVRSIYRWEGEVQSEAEVLVVFKTTRRRYPEFSRSLASRHPYDVPEVIALDPADVLPAYARWVAAACTGE